MNLWLVEKRHTKALTQQQVAKEVHISRAYYTLIELGNRRPSPQLAQKIGGLLGFDWKRFYDTEQVG